MARKKVAGPTEKELQILGILWKRGPSTVREVNALMHNLEPTGYTTTLKLMQIMYDKRLLTRDSSSKIHVYTVAVSEAEVQEGVVGRLLDSVFAGSMEKLVLRALSSRPPSAEELSNIRKLIKAREADPLS
jgi:BlaI family transcriptional regulator, penicillinase repressor